MPKSGTEASQVTTDPAPEGASADEPARPEQGGSVATIEFVLGQETVNPLPEAIPGDSSVRSGSVATLCQPASVGGAEVPGVGPEQSGLSQIVETLQEGVAIFDAEDRLVLCNRKYRDLMPLIGDLIVPGVKFEALATAAAMAGQNEDAKRGSGDWIRRRVEAHRDPSGDFEQNLADGRCVRTVEFRVGDGHTVSTYVDVTELKRREAALQAKSALMEVALENMEQGICILTPDLKVAAFNQRLLDLVSTSRDKYFVGADVREILRENAEAGFYGTGNDGEFAEHEIQAMEQGQPVHRERVTPDGLVLDITGRPTPDGGFVVTYSDVTELRQREAELSHKSALMEVALENMEQGICILTPDLKVAAFNQRLLDLVSMSEDNYFIGADIRQILRTNAEAGYYGNGNSQEYAEHEIATMEMGQPVRRERISPDGQSLEVAGRPLPDGGFVVTYSDVTELRQGKAELSHKSALMEVALENMDQGICILTPDLKIAALNRRLLDLLSMGHKHYFVGADMQDIMRANAEAGYYGPANAPELAEPDIAVLEQRQPLYRERTEPNGLTIKIVGQPLPDGGFVVTYNDVTESRRAEQRMSQGQKMEALGQLAGGIAHEFNNLLTSIRGFTRMAMKQPDDARRVKECLKEVSEAANRATNLTKQMLTFSHKQVLEPRVVRIGEMIRGMEKLLRAFMEESITLKIGISAGRACARVDPDRLSQSIVNLAINARHAMPGGGNLEIGCDIVEAAEGIVASHGDELPPGEYIRIYVRDAGTGIPADVLEHIFEPFFTTRDSGAGTGLGLSMVYGMVRNIKGAIDVETAIDAGTTFSIYLPVVHEEPAAEEKPAVQQATFYPGSETILVAEDDHQLRGFVRTILEDLGYAVLVAADGIEALKIFEENQDAVHLLVTDVVMPGMSGVALARRLAELRPELKSVYMTGYAPELSDALGGLDDDLAILHKPFELDALAQLVREKLDG